MTWELWTRIGIVCGSLIALGTVLGWAYKRVVLPMFKRTRRNFRRLNRGMDDLLGKPEEYDFEGNLISPAVTSLRFEVVEIKKELKEVRAENVVLREELQAVKNSVDTHVQWHPAPGGRPAGQPVQKRRRNGGTTPGQQWNSGEVT